MNICEPPLIRNKTSENTVEIDWNCDLFHILIRIEKTIKSHGTDTLCAPQKMQMALEMIWFWAEIDGICVLTHRSKRNNWQFGRTLCASTTRMSVKFEFFLSVFSLAFEYNGFIYSPESQSSKDVIVCRFFSVS